MLCSRRDVCMVRILRGATQKRAVEDGEREGRCRKSHYLIYVDNARGRRQKLGGVELSRAQMGLPALNSFISISDKL